LPDLLPFLASQSESLRQAAIVSLGLFKEDARDAAPALREAAKAEQSAIRAAALTALSHVESDPGALLPVLLTGLEDPERDVRHPAAEAIGRLGENGREAVPMLCRMLNAEEDRTVAIDALRQVRVNSVPHLIEALQIKEPAVRLFACEALGQLGAEAKEAVPELRKLFDDEYDFVRRQARNAIRAIERGSRD
jgi:HEAT repeat protein